MLNRSFCLKSTPIAQLLQYFPKGQYPQHTSVSSLLRLDRVTLMFLHLLKSFYLEANLLCYLTYQIFLPTCQTFILTFQIHVIIFKTGPRNLAKKVSLCH
jgi:hypothetical protein